jgi:hypothetical protein
LGRDGLTPLSTGYLFNFEHRPENKQKAGKSPPPASRGCGPAGLSPLHRWHGRAGEINAGGAQLLHPRAAGASWRLFSCCEDESPSQSPGLSELLKMVALDVAAYITKDDLRPYKMENRWGRRAPGQQFSCASAPRCCDRRGVEFPMGDGCQGGLPCYRLRRRRPLRRHRSLKRWRRPARLPGAKSSLV